tara:strand:- start:14 stop:712 length:699 start_codon:yes stop_codon:yes gene_type:complete
LYTKSDGVDITGITDITSSSDGKLNLRVPSGDSSDWNYIQFYGENGSRDGYVGTSATGQMYLSQDGGSRFELHQSVPSVAYLNGDRIATWGTVNTFSGAAGAVTIAANSDIRLSSGTWTGDSAAKIQHHNNILYIQGGSNGFIFRSDGGVNRCRIDSSGHFRPNSTNSYDLGTSTYRWRNIYTNDLNLSNEGGGNDVDGTWGNYTIQEGENDLYLINRRNGKKYKFNLTEVN